MSYWDILRDIYEEMTRGEEISRDMWVQETEKDDLKLPFKEEEEPQNQEDKKPLTFEEF